MGGETFFWLGADAETGSRASSPQAVSTKGFDPARVLKFLTTNGETHTRWAEYFEAYPEIEAQYVATGEWDDAKEHRRLEAGYAEAAALITTLCPPRSEPTEWR